MKTMIALVLAAAFGYFLGSLNFSIIVVQMMKGRDIRTMGSKNAGLTNTYRCCGPACAGLTLAGDLLKGVIAVALARWFASILSAGLSPDNDTHYIGYIAGFFAIIGHVFPIYYGFKGGKGVLVGVASFLIIDTKVFFALILIFIVILAWIPFRHAFDDASGFLVHSLECLVVCLSLLAILSCHVICYLNGEIRGQ